MDPNAALKRIREITCEISGNDFLESVDELVELFNALDDWLVHGGYLPTAWKKAVPRADTID